MSTLVENVAKVTAAHAALKTAIASKGVAVPDGTKLTGMPALVKQISTESVPTNPRAVFAGDDATSVVVPKTMVVDMTSLKNLALAFYQCQSMTTLELPDGFGRNAVSIGGCFAICNALTSLKLPEGFGQNAETMAQGFIGCFQNCNTLTTLVLPDGFGQKAESLVNCFGYCNGLVSVHLPTGFGRNSTSNRNCFYDCSKLVDITGNPNFKTAIVLSYSPNLTHDSLMVVINGLQTVTSSQALTLGSTNLAKLTDAEKKVATDKGWTLA